MTWPTGALSVAKDYLTQARDCEARVATLLDNQCWTTATEQYLEAEKLKAQAGLEFLLWLVSWLNMPAEPSPWKEYIERERLKDAGKEAA